MTAPELLLLAGAGLVAGTASAMAGGASLLTFPALLAFGLPPLSANVTNTTGLVPTSVGAALASREELSGRGRRLAFLALPATLGALAGAGALVIAPPGVFEAIVPFLIAASSVMLVMQPLILRRAGERLSARNDQGSWLGTLAACVYAGYFGAAAAVLFMALVGLFSTESIHELNAMKNVLIGVANAVAAVTFAFAAPVDWTAAAALAVGSLLGGVAGGRLVRHIPAGPLRIGIAVVGVAVAVWLLID